MHNVREQIPFQTPITLPVVSLHESIMSNFSLTKFSSENVHVLMFLYLIFLTFIPFVSFSVCTAGLEMEDGLCLDPNRPRRYLTQQLDTTITTEVAMISLQVRVRGQEPGGGGRVNGPGQRKGPTFHLRVHSAVNLGDQVFSSSFHSNIS